MRKVLLVTNIPTPYRLPLFERMDARLREEGIELHVAFAARGYARRLWETDLSSCGFDHTVLSSRAFVLGGNAERTWFSYGGLLRVIRRYRPDVVIVPGFSAATLRVWALSHARTLRYLIWSGATEDNPETSSRARRWMRRTLAAGAAGAVAYGKKAKSYLVGLGIPEDRVEIGINTVDTTFFAEETEWKRRKPKGVSGPPSLTIVGYLSPRKNVRKALEVVRILASRRRDFVVDVVGDGEERVDLEAWVRRHGLEDMVRFHGYRQRTELPDFYARSRCLLFQTDFDIWGLVLLEAMAAGLPCIASVHAGATTDLIEDGVNGFAADFADPGRVAGLVERFLDDDPVLAGMGQRARDFVAEHASIERSAEGFVRAVTRSLSRAIV